MLRRHAILIANAVAYGVTSKNIPASVVKDIVQELTSRLDNLGDYTYEVTPIVNERMDDAAKKIRRTIKNASKSCELMFIYYFGHGVRPPEADEDLYLFFKDSDWLDLPSMLDFRDIIKWLKSYKIPKVAIALDCCYAGIVRNKLRLLEEYGGKFYLMASVTNKGQAEVDYANDRPIGVFSKHLLGGFVNHEARVPLGLDVTFESLFGYAQRKTIGQSKQIPFGMDGGVAKEVFFRQFSTPTISPGVRASVPKKTAYRKLFILCSYLLVRQYKDEEALYSFVAAKKPQEFLTPVKIKDDTIEYRFMSETAFYSYIELCRELGLVETNTPIRLTALGKSMMRRDGTNFNKDLFAAVKIAWKRFGIELTDIEQAIGTRMRNNGIPTVQGIYSEMYVSKRLRMSKEFFRILLDLTAYVGVFRYSRDHTFFLPNFRDTPEFE